MSTTSIERPLGPTEEMYFRFDAMSPLNFAVAARLRGPIEPGAIEGAMAAVQARHPLLRVRIEPDAKDVPWFRATSSPIPVRLVEAEPALVWSTVEAELNASIDTTRGPLLHVTLVRHADDDATLVMVFHHAIADGRSASFLVRDLLTALAMRARGEVMALPELPPVGYYGDRIPPFDARDRKRGLETVWKTLKASVLFMRGAGLPVGLQKTDPRAARLRDPRVVVEPRVLEGDALRRAIARAKAESTTMQCVLNAALSLSVAEDSPPGPMQRTSCTQVVDIRGRLVPPVGEDCGLFATGITSLHVVDPNADFWAFAREIREHMDHSISTPLPFFHPAMHGLVTQVSRGLGVTDDKKFSEVMHAIHPEGLAVSNLGRVDVVVPGSPLRLAGFAFATNTSVLNDLSTSAVTFDGRMTWAFNGAVGLTRARLARIADRSMERIAAAVDAPA